LGKDRARLFQSEAGAAHGASIPKARRRPFRYTAAVKCFECNQRKAKRACPALGRGICAQCCGEKRVIEIPCPTDCVYLAAGATHQHLKSFLAFIQDEPDPNRRRKFLDTMDRLPELIFLLEGVLVGYARDLRAFTDREAADAVGLALETYRTESRGVLYENRAPNPLTQGLVRELRSFLEDLRERARRKAVAFRLSDVIDSLDLLHARADFFTRTSAGPRAFLDFTAKNHPEIERDEKRGGIIIAGS
jgi:hypothetical protein